MGVLVLVALAQFIVILDTTIVNVALPSIQSSFGLSPENLQWVVTAYTLAGDRSAARYSRCDRHHGRGDGDGVRRR
jgi:predicted MFS family arabinose efflux permease